MTEYQKTPLTLQCGSRTSLSVVHFDRLGSPSYGQVLTAVRLRTGKNLIAKTLTKASRGTLIVYTRPIPTRLLSANFPKRQPWLQNLLPISLLPPVQSTGE